MSSLITDTVNNTEVKYVIKVNGVVRTAPLPQALIESALRNLPVEEQTIAQVVSVTSSGQEILLG